MKAVVINYGVGNLFSISSALKRCGFEVSISDVVQEADLIVFPGVGSFSSVAQYLLRNSQKINEAREKGTKFLGVCLGMQIMFEKGTEGGVNLGLGWIQGTVDKLKTNLKLPHIGWERVYAVGNAQIAQALDSLYVYYAHSYATSVSQNTLMVSFYGVRYPALIANDFAIGTQFHPEKSGKAGVVFFENLVEWLKK
ncbi:imidazole glycerol phosphate synthase subunit HisH [Candidatus Marsarchaeota G1 archaeon OSP_B]|jgi:imidazole glycerol phosphate synthase subunit hisH (EC 2.4.2.-)|uniref:Imidazole glycerol phosphate synthase subunit HisH n=4 Tax=Candidatus Marsarchaeota group 1 TaxID=2203770 RepID=A0A2R6AIR3_9ARCH|nr:MAG: imidazole glycerol phosphate synthase subunit HisH [Candidatus Marsarchaeota G1 archaeon OSP_D]PSN86213.1 MAG: imidazole glycerol phosphate synthase subunit HisH [Candidatus Marsarchaeota G1 archaeon BE_D]PSN88770.1 MAG: imidazole glycerol phosphate synthase subunit HisH [Candidatus Marsarchaeota G1 archaeon OSP_C]PSN96382.1 MAG: imidazole glycerol phosphate synthase subunit HisH [Candidatus Marsarchaeota G1 archaeon OSP_B]